MDAESGVDRESISLQLKESCEKSYRRVSSPKRKKIQVLLDRFGAGGKKRCRVLLESNPDSED